MSDMEAQTASSKPSDPIQDPGFEARHKKELGIGKFAGESAFNSLFPLLSSGLAGALGYFALAMPVAMVLPKKLVKGWGAVESLGGSAWSALGTIMERGMDLLSGNENNMRAATKELADIFKTSAENVPKIMTIFRGSGTKNEKLVLIAEAIGRELPKVPQSIKWATGGVLGFLGLMGGGIAVGYREWRKKESARLAAGEINRDIANMELFKPSDPELVSENKRLRAMVSALPTVDPATVQSQGRLEDRPLQPALS